MIDAASKYPRNPFYVLADREEKICEKGQGHPAAILMTAGRISPVNLASYAPYP